MMTVIAPKAISLNPSCFAVKVFAMANPITARMSNKNIASATQADITSAAAKAIAVPIASKCAVIISVGESFDNRRRRKQART